MTVQLQQQIATLFESFGRSAVQDLDSLGSRNVSEQLQQAVAACAQISIPQLLVGISQCDVCITQHRHLFRCS